MVYVVVYFIYRKPANSVYIAKIQNNPNTLYIRNKLILTIILFVSETNKEDIHEQMGWLRSAKIEISVRTRARYDYFTVPFDCFAAGHKKSRSGVSGFLGAAASTLRDGRRAMPMKRFANQRTTVFPCRLMTNVPASGC